MASGPIYEPAEIKAAARGQILDAYERYVSELVKLGGSATRHRFVDRYNSGKIAVDAWVRDAIPHITRNTLLNWTMRRAQSGASGLLGRYRGQPGSIVSKTPGLAEAIAAFRARSPKSSAAQILAELREQFPGLHLGLRALQRYLADTESPHSAGGPLRK